MDGMDQDYSSRPEHYSAADCTPSCTLLSDQAHPHQQNHVMVEILNG